MTDTMDKRRYHRFLALLEVRVLPGEGVPADLRLATIDVSVGGARCASNRPLEEGTRLQITLTLVGGALGQNLPIDAEVSVLRCTTNPRAPETRRYELALQFVKMETGDRSRLQGYLNSL